MTALQYKNSLRSLLQVDIDGFPESTIGKGFRTYAQANRVSSTGAESILEASEAASQSVDWQTLSGCTENGDRACPKQWLSALAKQAFRRPISPEEQECTGF